MKDLRFIVDMDSGNLSHRIGKLIHKQLIERHPFPRDRRITMITKAGDAATNEPSPDPRIQTNRK